MVEASVITSQSRKAALLALLLLAPAYGASAGTLPATGSYLTGLGGDGLVFFQDGSVRTIQFTDATTFAICLDQVSGNAPLNSIADGSSNTLQFGDGSVRVVSGRVTPRVPISQIADGTSNTIIIGEIGPDSLCLGNSRVPEPGEIGDGTSNTIIIGEQSEFDVCFRNVRIGTIADGTSNTIQFGDVTSTPTCFQDVRLPAAEVAEPGGAPAVALGLVALAASLARRRRRT